MARGALRGAGGAVLTLIVLQGLTGKASGKVGSLVDALNQLVSRALDPKVAAIPDHSHPAGGSSSGSSADTVTINGQPVSAQGLANAGATGQSIQGIGNALNNYLDFPDLGLPNPAATNHPSQRIRIPVNP